METAFPPSLCEPTPHSSTHVHSTHACPSSHRLDSCLGRGDTGRGAGGGAGGRGGSTGNLGASCVPAPIGPFLSVALDKLLRLWEPPSPHLQEEDKVPSPPQGYGGSNSVSRAEEPCELSGTPERGLTCDPVKVDPRDPGLQSLKSLFFKKISISKTKPLVHDVRSPWIYMWCFISVFNKSPWGRTTQARAVAPAATGSRAGCQAGQPAWACVSALV